LSNLFTINFISIYFNYITVERTKMIDIPDTCVSLIAIQEKLMLNQKELAEKMGISYATLYRFIYQEEWSFSMATLRKVKRFVDRHSKEL
jgi:predicted transcriptional regulator